MFREATAGKSMLCSACCSKKIRSKCEGIAQRNSKG